MQTLSKQRSPEGREDERAEAQRDEEDLQDEETGERV